MDEPMPSTPRNLAQEVGKQSPFEIPEQEAYLNILRTQDHLSADFVKLFREFGLSEPLYNALRIIAARGQEGVPSQSIGEDMVTRDPDVTRLCDRLQAAGFVERKRSELDRRVVRVCITELGLQRLAELTPRIEKLHKTQLGHLRPEQLTLLNELLVAARNPKE